MVRRFKQEDSEGVKTLILSILAQEYPFDKNAYADSDIFDITGTYSGGKNAFFVFQEGKRIVGTAGIKSDSEKIALLRRLFVDPKYRRKGIGASLLTKSVEFCRDNGYEEIVFRATDRMKDAIKLLTNKGFTEKERLEVAGFHIHMYRMEL